MIATPDNIVALPTTPDARRRLADAPVAGEPADITALRRRNRNLHEAAVAIARMWCASANVASGLEVICDTERARADAAEHSLNAERVRSAAVLAKLYTAVGEIEELRRQLVQARADAAQIDRAHEMGIATLQAVMSRRQEKIEAAAVRIADLEMMLNPNSDPDFDRAKGTPPRADISMRAIVIGMAISTVLWGLLALLIMVAL